jgi:hypothetical protein
VDKIVDGMSNAQTMRGRVFYQLEGLVTRIVGAVGSSNILPERKKKLASIVKKYRGKRATPLPEPVPVTTADAIKINSTAQRSFDRQEDNFLEILTFLKGEPNYLTNELDLQVDVLVAMMSELVARNQAVRDSMSAYTMALITRDRLFYEEDSGLVACGHAVKSYVKSAFKAVSLEYKSISGIAFKNRKIE